VSTATRQWRVALEAEYQARVRAWSDIQGHLAWLLAAATSHHQPRLLELGVRSGNSTAALLLAADRADGHLWSVDAERPRVPSWWPMTGRWTLLVGDDLALAEEAAADPLPHPRRQGWLLPDQVDLLLVDTSHTYEHTLAELQAYVPRMRPGGLVCCHDVELVGHDQRGFGLTGPDGPVRRALDDYCAAAGLSWEHREGSFGLGVIRVPD
jgi:predicted O-methyltransferase YrrM